MPQCLLVYVVQKINAATTYVFKTDHYLMLKMMLIAIHNFEINCGTDQVW